MNKKETTPLDRRRINKKKRRRRLLLTLLLTLFLTVLSTLGYFTFKTYQVASDSFSDIDGDRKSVV